MKLQNIGILCRILSNYIKSHSSILKIKEARRYVIAYKKHSGVALLCMRELEAKFVLGKR